MERCAVSIDPMFKNARMLTHAYPPSLPPLHHAQTYTHTCVQARTHIQVYTYACARTHTSILYSGSSSQNSIMRSFKNLGSFKAISDVIGNTQRQTQGRARMRARTHAHTNMHTQVDTEIGANTHIRTLSPPFPFSFSLSTFFISLSLFDPYKTSE